MKEKKNYYLCNVVTYDGSDSYVEKFIIDCDDKVTAQDYIESTYGIDVVFIDELYYLDKDGLMAIIRSDEQDKQCITDRFLGMYL